jgi:hypothetical protein
MGLGKNSIIAAAAIVAIGAAVVAFKLLDPFRKPLSQREIATRVLGEYAGRKVHPSSVLVLSNPFTKFPGKPAEVYEFQKAGERGLKKGFGDAVKLEVYFPKLKEGALENPAALLLDPETSTPLSFLTQEQAWFDAVRAHPDCKLIASLIGVPLHYRELIRDPAFADKQFAFLLPDWRMIGSAADVRREFSSGRIVAAIVSRPGADANAKGGTNEKKEFDRLFILATAENIDQILSR